MFYLVILLALVILLPLILCPKPKKPQQVHYDCILVLGCPSNEHGELTPSLARRIELASQLYHKGVSDVFLLSGGSVRNAYCEAEVMEKALRATCPLATYYLDRKARNTFENFEYAKEICQQHHLKQIAIVSDASHVRRSAFFARKFFTEFVFYGAKEPFSLKKRLREFFALYNTLYYEIKLKSPR